MDMEVFVPLKHLSNFWRCLDLLLINCETELDLSWSRNCIISEWLRSAAVNANPDAAPHIAAEPTTSAIRFH